MFFRTFRVSCFLGKTKAILKQLVPIQHFAGFSNIALRMSQLASESVQSTWVGRPATTTGERSTGSSYPNRQAKTVAASNEVFPYGVFHSGDYWYGCNFVRWVEWDQIQSIPMDGCGDTATYYICQGRKMLSGWYMCMNRPATLQASADTIQYATRPIQTTVFQNVSQKSAEGSCLHALRQFSALADQKYSEHRFCPQLPGFCDSRFGLYDVFEARFKTNRFQLGRAQSDRWLRSCVSDNFGTSPNRPKSACFWAAHFWITTLHQQPTQATIVLLQ